MTDHAMSRKDREITDRQDILRLMDSCPVMYLGMAAGEQPYVLPLNFAYEEQGDKLYIYFHAALTGRKAEVLQENPRCCLAMTAHYALVQGERACQWSASFASVLIEGRAELLRQAPDRKRALDFLMARYGFEGAPQYDPAVLSRTALYRVEALRVSAKSRPAPSKT